MRGDLDSAGDSLHMQSIGPNCQDDGVDYCGSHACNMPAAFVVIMCMEHSSMCMVGPMGLLHTPRLQ